MLQAGETDYAFLRRRAARIGFDFWISEQHVPLQADARGRRRRRRRCAGAATCIAFTVRFAAAERCDEVAGARLGPARPRRRSPAGPPKADPGTDAPAAPGDGATPRSGRSGGCSAPPASSRWPTRREADALAAVAAAARVAASEVVLRGEAAGDPLLGAGAKVTIEGVGTRLAGNYRVTSVEHIYGAGPPVRHPVRLRRQGAGRAGRPRRRRRAGAGGSGRGWGGLVVGRRDQQRRPGEAGPGEGDSSRRCPTRTRAPGRGSPPRAAARSAACSGCPRSTTRCWSASSSTTTTRPVVLGGLWNRKDTPPQPDAASAAAWSSAGAGQPERLAADVRPTTRRRPCDARRSAGGSCQLHLEQSSRTLDRRAEARGHGDQIEVDGDPEARRSTAPRSRSPRPAR